MQILGGIMSQAHTVLFAAIASVFFSVPSIAQTDPAQTSPPPSPTTGSVSFGLALTGGNTDTSNLNFAAELTRDPKTRNIIKFKGLYLRGDEDDDLTVNRTSANLRDEYTLSGRAFLFGQLDYLKDEFKDISYLLAPTAGLGYKFINTDRTLFLVDGGAGGLWEKNSFIPVRSSGSVTAGQRFSSKVSPTVTLTQSLGSLFKMDDFGDSLLTFAAGVSTSLGGALELKVEFLDTYKNKPAQLGIEKNDTAFVTALVVKFE
jgi:putative salt-induced outer membrane protein YdiY